MLALNGARRLLIYGKITLGEMENKILRTALNENQIMLNINQFR